MKTVVTGTVGVEKGPYLDKVAELAREEGKELTIAHVGERMYAEAPDVARGRILDLPLSRLHLLRRSVFKDILALAERTENVVVNTHATFRWKHGLFPAFDFDQLAQLEADLYVCLLDNVDRVHARLLRDHLIDHTLKDLLVWREEEILATDMMMLGSQWPRKKKGKLFVLAEGTDMATIRTLYRLIFHPEMRKAYVSFPMTHVMDQPAVLAEIESFKERVQESFIVFDPADLDEMSLYLKALKASEKGQRTMDVAVLGEMITFDVAEVIQVAGDIHAQIYARDFLLIDQAEMIISYIPELPSGKPGLSSGVERELQHAHEATKDVYVIWRSREEPSPFVTETATEVFETTEEALGYFETKGYIKATKGQGMNQRADSLFPE